MPADRVNGRGADDLTRVLLDALTIDNGNLAMIALHPVFLDRVDVQLPQFVLDRGFDVPGGSPAADEFWASVAEGLRARVDDSHTVGVSWQGRRIAVRGDRLAELRWVLTWPEGPRGGLPDGHPRAVLPSEPARIVVALPDGAVLSVNDAYRRLVGTAVPEFGRPLAGSLPASWAATAAGIVDELARGSSPIERVLVTRRQPPRWLQVTAHVLEPEAQLPPRGVIAISDITSLRLHSPEVFERLVRDPVTGLLNRRATESLIDGDEITATPFVAAAVVALTRFSAINDVWGHEVGDRCLIEVARALAGAAAVTDVLARPYGDEILLLSTADSCLLDFVAGWGEQTVLADGYRVPVSLRTGLSHRRPGEPLRELVRHAEQAHSRAEHEHAAGVTLWTPALQAAAQRQAEDETAVRELLDTGRLAAHFQPIVDVGEHRVAGFEALLRVADNRPAPDPQRIVDTARRLGSGAELHRQIITHACGNVADLTRRYPGSRVSVNISREQFATGEAVGHVLRTAAEAGLPTAALTLELTEELAESVALDTLRHEIQRCRAAGLRVVVDDFGRGETSLSLLRDLDFAAIKMDRSLLPTDDDAGGWRFVAGTVAMLATLTREVVAEGVETAAQSRRLLELGVSRQQGYLFGRAEPAAHWLQRDPSTVER